VVLPSEHWPQAPEGWQAGVAPPQSTSPPQARQACVAVLHTGLVPPHWAFDTQATQLPPLVSQTGVAPLHWFALVAEHWPQAPQGSHAGVPPPHSPSPPQARQACVAVLQIGLLPLHCAFERQGTQVPDVA